MQALFRPTRFNINGTIFAYSIRKIPGVHYPLRKTLTKPKSLCDNEVLPEK